MHISFPVEDPMVLRAGKSTLEGHWLWSSLSLNSKSVSNILHTLDFKCPCSVRVTLLSSPQHIIPCSQRDVCVIHLSDGHQPPLSALTSGGSLLFSGPRAPEVPHSALKHKLGRGAIGVHLCQWMHRASQHFISRVQSILTANPEDNLQSQFYGLQCDLLLRSWVNDSLLLKEKEGILNDKKLLWRKKKRQWL